MDDRLCGRSSLREGLGQCRIDEIGVTVPVDRPADHLSRVAVQDDAAVALALSRRVLGDVCEPQLVRTIGREVALDEVITGGDVLQVLHVPARSGQAVDAELSHDLRDQLLVDDEPLFDLERRPDAESPVCAARAGMDIGDEIGEQQPADLRVGWRSELDVVVRRAVKTDCRTATTF